MFCHKSNRERRSIGEAGWWMVPFVLSFGFIAAILRLMAAAVPMSASHSHALM